LRIVEIKIGTHLSKFTQAKMKNKDLIKMSAYIVQVKKDSEEAGFKQISMVWE
jgi:hypothetical protein